MFGRTTQWGYRTNKGGQVWCGSKGEAQRKIRRINNKTSRTGEEAKLIQRQVPKEANTKLGGAIEGRIRNTDKCSGGKCNKRGNVCKKHFKAMTKGSRARGGQYTASEFSLENIHARWDEDGHRWS